MNYSYLKSRITEVLLQTTDDGQKLKTLHRQLEKENARLTLDDNDDKVLKDVEFLLRSAILLKDIGQPNDWRLQLEAATAVLDGPTNIKY